jgi:hypothetical protein
MARKTNNTEHHITHTIKAGIECYSEACLTGNHDDKKCSYFLYRNDNILGTFDGLERQMGSPNDIY